MMKRRQFLQLSAIVAAGVAVDAMAAWPAYAADVLSVAPAAGPFAPHLSAIAAPVHTTEPDELLTLLLETVRDGAWHWKIQGETAQGRSFSAPDPLLLQQGRRYRLRMMNATGTAHRVRLRHHKFELARFRQAPVSGLCSNTVHLERFDVVEADVVIHRPGAVFLQYSQPLVIN